jgi:hypothetical protein
MSTESQSVFSESIISMPSAALLFVWYGYLALSRQLVAPIRELFITENLLLLYQLSGQLIFNILIVPTFLALSVNILKAVFRAHKDFSLTHVALSLNNLWIFKEVSSSFKYQLLLYVLALAVSFALATLVSLRALVSLERGMFQEVMSIILEDLAIFAYISATLLFGMTIFLWRIRKKANIVKRGVTELS